MRIHFLALLLPSLLVWSACPAWAADEWPQFRGPSGQGFSDADNLPITWSENRNIAWKTDLPGRGWSSPVVSGGEIWVTTAVETAARPEEKERRLAGRKHQESLDVAQSVSFRGVCIDLADGRVKRNLELFQVDQPQPIHQLNGYASPTPVIEAGYLWCDFGAFGTVCLQTTTGELLWKRQLPIDHEVGPGSSPIIHGNLLILTRDGCDRQYIAGLDKLTGQTVWKTDRPRIDLADEFKKAFSTPLLCQTASGPQVISPGAQWVVSYGPSTGQPIWWAGYAKGYSLVPRPVFGDGVVYICTTSPGHQLWAIRTDGRGDVTKTHVEWIVKRQVPNKVSPLLVGANLHMVTDTGVLTCLDVGSGEDRWTQRLGGNFSASPLATPAHLYFFGQDGRTSIFDAAGSAEPVAENRLPGQVVATPAITGNTLLVRTETHLWAIRRGGAAGK